MCGDGGTTIEHVDGVSFFVCNDCRYQLNYIYSEETAELAVRYGVRAEDADNFLNPDE